MEVLAEMGFDDAELAAGVVAKNLREVRMRPNSYKYTHAHTHTLPPPLRIRLSSIVTSVGRRRPGQVRRGAQRARRPRVGLDARRPRRDGFLRPLAQQEAARRDRRIAQPDRQAARAQARSASA